MSETIIAKLGDPNLNPSLWSNQITFQFIDSVQLSIIDELDDTYYLLIDSVENGSLWEAIPVIEKNHFGNEIIIGYNLKLEVIPIANPGVFRNVDNQGGESLKWLDLLEKIQSSPQLNTLTIIFNNKVMSVAKDSLLIKCENKMRMVWNQFNNEKRLFYKITIKGFATNRELESGALKYS